MRVIYAKSITEQMDEHIRKAKENGKQIREFILSKSEFELFKKSEYITALAARDVSLKGDFIDRNRFVYHGIPIYQEVL